MSSQKYKKSHMRKLLLSWQFPNEYFPTYYLTLTSFEKFCINEKWGKIISNHIEKNGRLELMDNERKKNLIISNWIIRTWWGKNIKPWISIFRISRSRPSWCSSWSHLARILVYKPKKRWVMLRDLTRWKEKEVKGTR